MQNPSVRFALVYLGIGIVWTVTTNTLIYYYSPHSNSFLWFFLRSLAFVILCSVGVYFIFRAHYRVYNTAERKYEQLFQHYPHAMWIYDTETYRFLKVNDAAINKYGYTKDEFSRLTLFTLFPVREAADTRQKIEEIRDKEFNDGMIATHFKKDGSPFFVRLSSFKTTFHRRQARMVTAIDISLQMEAEIKVETLLNSSDDLIWLLNRKGKLITWNRSFSAKYSEITGSAFTGEQELNLFQLAETQAVLQWQNYFTRAIQGEHLKIEETAGEGTVETYEVIIEPISHDKYGFLGVGFFARDITSRKKNENEITEKINQLKEITWFQSHELRRPLANIMGLVELMKITPLHRTDELQEIIVQLEKSSQQLDSVVRLIVEKSSQSDVAKNK
jgi:PAS domain S-box-containing protein